MEECLLSAATGRFGWVIKKKKAGDKIITRLSSTKI